jgi:hypothetical protein
MPRQPAHHQSKVPNPASMIDDIVIVKNLEDESWQPMLSMAPSH